MSDSRTAVYRRQSGRLVRITDDGVEGVNPWTVIRIRARVSRPSQVPLVFEVNGCWAFALQWTLDQLLANANIAWPPPNEFELVVSWSAS